MRVRADPGALAVVTPGTQGQGDACAPSKTLASAIVVDDGAISVGYEIPGIYGLLARGVAVVVTDYIGLGTTDRVHTYAVRLDLGHAVLDAARSRFSLSLEFKNDVVGRESHRLHGTTARGELLDEARKLITALAGFVTAAAPEIGSQHAGPLRDGLRTLQLAFREASTYPDKPGQGPGEKFTGPVFS